MARWEPDAYGRLRNAALALFAEQGFEKTTVAQIAERAGLNRRTFFHHFADKREVVFAGQGDSGEVIVAEIRAQPENVDPLHAATAGLSFAADTIYEQYRKDAAKLDHIVAASPELQERELVKRATLADKIATALRDRGTAEPAATIAAWTAVAVFFAARNRWSQGSDRRSLAELIEATLEEFISATADPSPST
ncbi:TetR/AcrR family transcriptional regulator [Actinoallomurus soli]|uniref:TetR/AcrR family transcriptional regulator n=1 Tax=Actinoallomurus soli TaxID=2952535 RepID=UPI002091F3A2|nr:TetR/AcrR family transcriptional regulator [Actinoallomurus soli]MCO5974915.1 TetR/AcrR family transcriptional regulator [Actinoallomurus soli]